MPSSNNVESSRHRWVKPFFKNLKYCRARKSSIVHFSKTELEIMNVNGQYFNYLNGYYYDYCPDDSLMVESMHGLFSWRTTNSYPCLCFAGSYILFCSSLLARLSLIIKKDNNPDLVILYNKYPSLFNLSELQRVDREVAIFTWLMKRFLKRVAPKVIFVNEACYGMEHGIITYLARQMGIKTIELQHGLISSEHEAYNAEQSLINNKEYQSYLPDEIWTFGQYWASHINWKIKKRVVGNPYMIAARETFNNIIEEYSYLIVSQPIGIEIFKSFVSDLAETHPNDLILIRLHPHENCRNYDVLLSKYSNLRLSNETSLYYDFCRCGQIIGIFSTCLYEALAFGRIPIIIDCELSRRFIEPEIGRWVKNAKELDDTIESSNDTVNLSYYWCQDFHAIVKPLIKEFILR